MKLYEKLEDFIYSVYWRLKDTRYHLRKIKWFFQRGRRGWAENNAWGFSLYISRVIRDAVKYLHDNAHSVPAEFYDGDFEAGLAEWKNTLNEIVFAFDCIIKADNAEIEIFKPRKDNPNEHYLPSSGYLEKHPSIHLQTKEEYDRMQKGFQLFITYFQSLMD